MKVLLTSGLLASVTDLQAIDTVTTVYNFEVEKTHTYYVGTEGVLVHNKCGIEALRKIRTGVTQTEWDDFAAAIRSVAESEVPTALRLPFYTELAKLDETALKSFIQDFKSADLDFRAGLLKEPSLVDIWVGNISLNINKYNFKWLRWVKNGRKIVPELKLSTSKHINKGEIRIDFRDGTPSFISTPEKVWAELETRFMNDETFAKALMTQDNIKGITFGGLHSIDEIDALAAQTINGNQLMSYTSKTQISTVSVNGKFAYNVEDPRVWIPSTDALIKANKSKPIANRQWTTVGREIRKSTPRISSTFLEGMTPAQVDNIISEAFVVKKVALNGRDWEGVVNLGTTKVTVSGILRNGEIPTAYITKIE